MTYRRRIQSPLLYLQAAGSPGIDGSARGIYLRWGLLGDLGANHLPKGNLAGPFGPYSSSLPYNRMGDFVLLFRAAYTTRYAVTVDLSTETPDRIVETDGERHWIYKSRTTPGGVHDVRIAFGDVAVYDALRAQIDPRADPYLLLRRYTGMVSASLEGDLFFAFEATVAGTTPHRGRARFEVLSRFAGGDDPAPFVSCRKVLTVGLPVVVASAARPTARAGVGLGVPGLTPPPKGEVRLVAENAYAVRFDCTGCAPTVIAFEPYEDFHAMVQEMNAGQYLGRFSLSLDDAEVLKRLEEPIRFQIGSWPRYGDGATVSLANYQDKWPSPGGLKEAVTRFLELSRTDARAEAALPADDPADTGALVVSHLDALKLVAQDFHAARMLGLAHIDALMDLDTQTFVYAAIYLTWELQDGALRFTENVFLSLPTSRADQRLPVTPELDRLAYGLAITSSTEARSLTDAAGYAPHADERIVNLIKKPFPYDFSTEGFFVSEQEFCLADVTRPTLIGVKYRRQGRTAWQRPELSNDPAYLSNLGRPEAVVFPERSPEPVFVHKETQPGVHEYALYGVNWFARASGPSNVLATDATVFPKRNTLLPPHNAAAQVIQEESPPLLTSATEQQRLAAFRAARPRADATVVRVTFDWTHAHNIAYQRGTLVELFFRADMPRVVQGAIKSIADFGTTVEVRTEAYQNTSLSPVETVMPAVAPGDEARFAGSLFVSARRGFRVRAVRQSSVADEGPIFVLAKIREEEPEDPDLENRFIGVVTYVAPTAGARFTVVENLADASGWTRLGKTVALIAFSDHRETETLRDGSTRELIVGGIWESARVTAVEDVDASGVPIAGSHSGVYRVRFDTYVLADHPDPDVDWYRGVARLPTAAGATAAAAIVRIVQQASQPLEILVAHPGFRADPLATGGGLQVNVHPGYRVYLRAQPGVLDQSTVFPAAGERSRKSLLAVRALDRAPNPDNASALSPPLVLLAREVLAAKPTGLPQGPAFATRPDSQGKSTYTFDTPVDTSGGRTPYALVFYRGSDRALLDALYQPATVRTIQADLPPRDSDEWFTTRWNDLANARLDAAGRFTSYAGYGFPEPDKSGLLTGSESPTEKAEKLREAMRVALTPLGERPVIYAHVRSGYQTRRTAPVLRDANDALLAPDTPAFDPHPAATRHTAGQVSFVRFTDYGLDGAARNVYFYAAVEITDTGARSALSTAAGPVQLVNTRPPPMPVIRSVRSQIEGFDEDTGPRDARVVVRVNPFPPGEDVAQVALYRATTAQAALDVRLMTEVGTFAVGADLVDTFADLDDLPYGMPIFYRAVARREITNERGGRESVPSPPSKIALANVVDVNRPAAPALVATAGLETAAELRDVVLSWEKAAPHATYQLFKRNSRGTWMKFYELKSNDPAMQYPPGSDFAAYPETAVLAKADARGKAIFHHFQIRVINASGMLGASVSEVIL